MSSQGAGTFDVQRCCRAAAAASAFMGILSREGRSGDDGKHSGWSPDEPTCGLNLSGERFPQFVVYPVPGDADPTSWRHAVPVGRWTHVAVVNDGHHTVIYVDNSI